MTTYNLTSLDLPTLNGRALRLFAAALDNGALRGVLLGPHTTQHLEVAVDVEAVG